MKKDLFKKFPIRILKDPHDKLADFRSKRRPLSKEDLEVAEAEKLLWDQIDDD